MMNQQRHMRRIIFMLLATVLTISACGSPDAASNTTIVTSNARLTTAETTGTAIAEKTFNKEELSLFNGQDGQPAYVAVDGVVYDVTTYPKWANGLHNGMTAGMDLTEGIKQSPHGTAIFDKKSVPIVGKYSN